jgi:hypothetical protein
MATSTPSGPDAETLYRGASGIALAVGILALVSPRLLVRVYGIDPAQMTDAGAFGWRLFAVRNIVIGTAGLTGHPAARDVTLLVQAPDQLVFLHAYRTRSIPRPTAVLAMITSGLVAGACALARTRG